MEYYIKKFQLGKWFEIKNIIYNDGTIPGKPNPDLYYLAAEAIQVEPRRCIVFEDSISGIQAAYNAGVRRIIAVVPKSRKINLRNYQVYVIQFLLSIVLTENFNEN